MIYHVGYLENGRFRSFGTFLTAIQAIRVARKLEDKDYSSIIVARIGGGTFFDLYWRRYKSICTRQWYRTLQNIDQTNSGI